MEGQEPEQIKYPRIEFKFDGVNFIADYIENEEDSTEYIVESYTDSGQEFYDTMQAYAICPYGDYINEEEDVKFFRMIVDILERLFADAEVEDVRVDAHGKEEVERVTYNYTMKLEDMLYDLREQLTESNNKLAEQDRILDYTKTKYEAEINSLKTVLEDYHNRLESLPWFVRRWFNV